MNYDELVTDHQGSVALTFSAGLMYYLCVVDCVVAVAASTDIGVQVCYSVKCSQTVENCC